MRGQRMAPVKKAVPVKKAAEPLDHLSDSDWVSKLSEASRRKLAGNVGVNADVLGLLTHDPSADVRVLVAGNPSMSATLLDELSADEDVSVRLTVAANPSTSPETLERLSLDRDGSVRRSVASNGCTPRGALTKFRASKRLLIREAVASNPNLGEIALRELAADKDSVIRLAVAGNPAAPVDVLCAFAIDEDREIREAAASNRALPAAKIEALASDPEWEVRRAAVRNGGVSDRVLTKCATDEDALVRRAVAQSMYTTESVWRSLAVDRDPEVRSAVFLNPATPVGLLEDLASSDKVEVRRLVAQNPRTPPQILKRLATGNASSVKGAAGSVPNDETTPPSGEDGKPMRLISLKFSSACSACAMKLAMGESAWWGKGQPILCQDCAKNPPRVTDAADVVAEHLSIQCAVAGNPSTPARVLKQLAASPAHDVRLALFGNRKVTVATMRLASKLETRRLGSVQGENSMSLASQLKSKKVADRIAGAIRGLEFRTLTTDEALSVIAPTKDGAYWLALRWFETRMEVMFEVLTQCNFSKGLSRALGEWLQSNEADRSLLFRILELRDGRCAQAICESVELDADLLDALSRSRSWSYTNGDPDHYAPGTGEWVVTHMGSANAEKITYSPQIVVARHRLTRAKTLAWLRKAGNKHVRIVLARRPLMPTVDTTPGGEQPVPVEALKQREAQERLLASLALDRDIDVRSAVFENPEVSDEIRAIAAILGVNSPEEFPGFHS